jgi:hypothetical protein
MDCNNARLLLELARPVPGELDAAESAALHEHLDQCPDCGALANAERRFDQILGCAVRDVPVPDGLRTRLLTQLDRQRDAWYRRFLTRRVLPIGAAAAAVLAVAFLGWQQFAERPRRVVDAEQLVAEVNARYHARRTDVDEWLRKFTGQEASAPRQFDYDKLDNYCITELENQRVPMLIFVRADTAHMAWVYVLSDHRFDLEKLKLQKTQIPVASGQPGPVRVSILPPENGSNQNVMYLVLYTGQELDPFFEKKPPVQ